MARTKRTKPSDAHMAAIDEYFRNGFRKTDALRAAGIASPEKHTWEIFTRVEVAHEIERRHRKIREKAENGVDRLVEEYKKLAYSNLDDYGYIDTDTGDFVVDLTEIPEDEQAAFMAAIGEFKTETRMEVDGYDGDGKPTKVAVRKTIIKTHNKIAAMEHLGRYYGMFNDKLEITGEMSLQERILEGRKRARAREKSNDGE